MIEVAEEFIETVRGRQEFITVAQVVFTELPSRVTQLLEDVGDGRIFFLQTLRRSRHTDFTHPGTEWHLAGNEGGTTCGGALLGVVGGKLRALRGDAVNVWRLVAHQTLIVGAQVQVADIIAKDNYDVRLFSILLRRCRVGCVSNGHCAGS